MFLSNEAQEVANNHTAALFNFGIGLGQVCGPLYGASMYQAVGFRNTQDITALLCVSYAILYFTFAGGRDAFQMTF